jgi:metal-responsive CopG/Arc/MetJ family transcriptional regulator
MVSTTDRDRTEKLGITLPISLLQKIDNKRGDIPRSTFIRRAIESYLRASLASHVRLYNYLVKSGAAEEEVESFITNVKLWLHSSR